MIMLNGEEMSIGDSVWSPIHGWGVVEGYRVANTSVAVRFKSTGDIRVLPRLIDLDSGLQHLYWGEVTIIPPEKPVKFVKKYVVCYKYYTSSRYYVTTGYYASEEEFSKGNKDLVFICLIRQSERLMADGG